MSLKCKREGVLNSEQLGKGPCSTDPVSLYFLHIHEFYSYIYVLFLILVQRGLWNTTQLTCERWFLQQENELWRVIPSSIVFLSLWQKE